MRVIGRILVLVAMMAGSARAQGWKIVEEGLKTPWAKDVSPERAWAEYPRPQMERAAWQNLNGLWDYAITAKGATKPEKWDGKILVPFCIESALSGVGKRVGPQQELWYRRSFGIDHPAGQRVLLNFEAVDWRATVYLNGKEVGKHEGAYDPFSFDVTDALKSGAANELVVRVWDPTDAGPQPRGKQTANNSGIFYTPVTGIWQTVWLETVPAAHLTSMKVTPSVDQSTVFVQLDVTGNAERVTVTARDGDKDVATASGKPGEVLPLKIASPKLWSPSEPFLYDLRVEVAGGDAVRSYFGMRKVELMKDARGFKVLALNGKPLFQYGPLDQGFWPDGIYTAPTDAALRFDVEQMKKLGFNMVRKHIKVEPARWYYWCDKLGLMVWQDMPSGSFDAPEARGIYQREGRRMVDHLHNQPSIVMWVPFNEGWGQGAFGPEGTREVAGWVKDYDPTRLVNDASGWDGAGAGDVHDAHTYPGPGMFAQEAGRASVLGEFGGQSRAVEGHMWDEKRKGFGYGSLAAEGELFERYHDLMWKTHLLTANGLAAAVYTQLTDVETELNGYLTYDRAVMKMPAEKVAALHAKLYGPPPEVKVLLPNAMYGGAEWRYTLAAPPGDAWTTEGFDASTWQKGTGGFGSVKPGPLREVKTAWTGEPIWMRVEFDGGDTVEPYVWYQTSRDAVVYLNGKELVKTAGKMGSYFTEAVKRDAIKSGKNVLAIRCDAPAARGANPRRAGEVFLDAGVIDVRSASIRPLGGAR